VPRALRHAVTEGVGRHFTTTDPAVAIVPASMPRRRTIAGPWPAARSGGLSSAGPGVWHKSVGAQLQVSRAAPQYVARLSRRASSSSVVPLILFAYVDLNKLADWVTNRMNRP
jgi:hypothetical protein